MSLRTCINTAVRGSAVARGSLAARPATCASPVLRQRLAQPMFRRFVSDDGSSKASSAAKDRSAVGPYTWKAAGLFIVTGVGLYFYFTNEKAKVQERRRQEFENKSVGRPNIGGPFTLVDHDGKPFTDQDLLGTWNLMYFGFTNCPDICPEELDKMSEVVDKIDKEKGPIITPVFVSVDPARDTVPAVKTYVSEFHPRLIGLTGDYDDVKRACKSYRVYFSTPPDATAADDYLVDHSIFFYLMDPLGQFVDAFGKNTTADEVTSKVREAVGKWEAAGGNKVAGVPEKK